MVDGTVIMPAEEKQAQIEHWIRMKREQIALLDELSNLERLYERLDLEGNNPKLKIGQMVGRLQHFMQSLQAHMDWMNMQFKKQNFGTNTHQYEKVWHSESLMMVNMIDSAIACFDRLLQATELTGGPTCFADIQQVRRILSQQSVRLEQMQPMPFHLSQ
ncbi:hypothetical protein [Marinicrinis sediminis]|uniref:DUF2383 domain-containing protein n=1 Tax=Marinicrinis sediminis TaxID=1652465 RepID=A0ABW5RF53_9BACL